MVLNIKQIMKLMLVSDLVASLVLEVELPVNLVKISAVKKVMLQTQGMPMM